MIFFVLQYNYYRYRSRIQFFYREENMEMIFTKSLAIVASVVLINTYALNASEYIVGNCKEDNKAKIYEIVSKYRFPSILSSYIKDEFRIKYPDLDLTSTFGTKENEYKFLQNEVKNIDKNTEVYAIPKSLYQFITYDYFAETILEPENPTAKTLFSKVHEQKQKFVLSQYATDNEERALTKACSRFMEDNDIKDIFWKVNDHTKALYGKCDGKIETMVTELFNAYKAEEELNEDKIVISKCPERLLDLWNTNQQQGINKTALSRIEILLGADWEGKTPDNWDKKESQALKNYTKSIIISEDKNPNYTLYHAGNLDDPKPEIAYRQTICFCDGLGSGFIFDGGASAFVLSGGKKKLFKLALDRAKLLNGEYPIFIPPAHHLLSGAGNGELFHVRTKVVQAVISNRTNSIDKDSLVIRAGTHPIIPGYQLNQTPEYFTTTTPQILKKGGNYGNYTYEKTDEGKFDKDGAEKLEQMIKNIKEVPENGKF